MVCLRCGVEMTIIAVIKPLPTGGCCEELKKTEKSRTDKPLPTGGCCEELKKTAEKK